MSPLTGADLYDWIGLRRVNGGRVVMLGERWLQSGHPVPDYVAEALIALHTRGFITLADPDLKKEVSAQAMLTTDGTLRYRQLCRQRLLEDRSARFFDKAVNSADGGRSGRTLRVADLLARWGPGIRWPSDDVLDQRLHRILMRSDVRSSKLACFDAIDPTCSNPPVFWSVFHTSKTQDNFLSTATQGRCVLQDIGVACWCPNTLPVE